jgi:hypothetical protein
MLILYIGTYILRQAIASPMLRSESTSAKLSSFNNERLATSTKGPATHMMCKGSISPSHQRNPIRGAWTYTKSAV